ncbi:MAG: TolC family protein [Verrucomicrobiae bacterium]|nr:TolC family protein [Verrucomicrobiae bacterium]
MTNRIISLGLLALLLLLDARAQTRAAAPWPEHPLTLNEALDITLRQSPAILKAKQDVEEAYGLSLELRSAVRPRLTASGAYQAVDEASIEIPPGFDFRFQNEQSWNANILVSQPVFAGGKLRSQVRAGMLTEEAALAQFQATVADAVLEVKVNYDDVLLAVEQIKTQEASVALLEQELTDQKRRYDAGTAPRFNVLRAEVELANARPRLIRAQNFFRIAKNNLATRLGWDIPPDTSEDIPLELADRLEAPPFDLSLPVAIAKGLQQRQELVARKTDVRLRREGVKQAQADYYPAVGIGGGYQWRSTIFRDDLSINFDGWTAGAQVNWNVWDFGATRGRVKAAKARLERSEVVVDDTARQIETEIRTAYSTVIEAQQVLESQQKVIEQAEEAVRLAMARNDAGSGTQLDVLSAQTALTDARTIHALALRDYSVALARLERAVGDGAHLVPPKP